MRHLIISAGLLAVGRLQEGQGRRRATGATPATAAPRQRRHRHWHPAAGTGTDRARRPPGQSDEMVASADRMTGGIGTGKELDTAGSGCAKAAAVLQRHAGRWRRWSPRPRA
jgi:hypothetical protein